MRNRGTWHWTYRSALSSVKGMTTALLAPWCGGRVRSPRGRPHPDRRGLSHRVRGPGPGVTVSLHVYGADIGRLGSSVRRVYDLPIIPR